MTTIHCPSCNTPLALVLPSVLPVEDRPEPVDLMELMRRTRVQSAKSAARVLFDTERPTRAQQERARRRLGRLVRAGSVRIRWTQDGRCVYVPTEPMDDREDATL